MHMKTVKLTSLYLSRHVLSSGLQIEATMIKSFIHLGKSYKTNKARSKNWRMILREKTEVKTVEYTSDCIVCDSLQEKYFSTQK